MSSVLAKSELERKLVLALESDLVPLERVHGGLEDGSISSGLSRDVVLVELDGDVEVLEDLLNRVSELRSDTVSRDEGDLQRGKEKSEKGEG